MRTTALLVGPTVAVLLGTPYLKPPPPPVEQVSVNHTPPIRSTVERKRRHPIPLKVDRIAPGKAQPKKKPGKATGSPPGLTGPDLPWPCWLIKQHAAGKSEAQLRAEGRAAGIKLTPKQEMQARACLKG